MEDCVTNAGKRGRKNTHAATKAASRETSPEDSLTVSISGLSLEERERQAMEDIVHIKLEQRVMDLEAKRDRLVSARRATASWDQVRHHDGWDNRDQACEGHLPMALGMARSRSIFTPHTERHAPASAPEGAYLHDRLRVHGAGAAAANFEEVSGRLREVHYGWERCATFECIQTDRGINKMGTVHRRTGCPRLSGSVGTFGLHINQGHA